MFARQNLALTVLHVPCSLASGLKNLCGVRMTRAGQRASMVWVWQREFCIDNPLVRIHLIIEAI